MMNKEGGKCRMSVFECSLFAILYKAEHSNGD